MLDRLDRAVIGMGDHPQTLARPVHGLVMRAADLELGRTEQARQAAVGVEFDTVVDHAVGRVGSVRVPAVVQVLNEVSPQRDVHQLHASADADERHPGLDCSSYDGDLRPVGIGEGLTEVRVIRTTAVERRIDILPTRYDHGVRRIQAPDHLFDRGLGSRHAVDREADHVGRGDHARGELLQPAFESRVDATPVTDVDDEEDRTGRTRSGVRIGHVDIVTDTTPGRCRLYEDGRMPVPHRAGLRVTEGVTIPEAELSWRFSRSSGPGGQGVNTADSRVELSWDAAGSSALSTVQRDRLLERLTGRLVDGVLTIAASEHRAQLRNRDAARERLAGVIADALRPPAPARRATKPSRGAKERRLKAKQRRTDVKQLRRRPTD